MQRRSGPPLIVPPSWVEIYFDAGSSGLEWAASFIGMRRFIDGTRKILVKEGAWIAGLFPGPTPVEGIAAVYALRWANEHEFSDFVTPGGHKILEPVVLFGDNEPVMAKLRNGNWRGVYRDIWRLMIEELETLKKSRRLVDIRTVRSPFNLAHSLSHPSDTDTVWTFPPS